MKRIVLLMALCCGVAMPPLAGIAAAQSTYLDYFLTRAYNGSQGTVSWTNSPWVETDHGGGGATGGDIFVVTASGCPQSTCLNVKAVESGDRVYRQANLGAATSATLSYLYCRDNAPGTIVAELSYDGGTSWTTVATYASPSTCPSVQTFPLSQFTSNTRFRLRVTATGGAILYVDEVQFAFTTGAVPTSTPGPPNTPTPPVATNTPTASRTATPTPHKH